MVVIHFTHRFNPQVRKPSIFRLFDQLVICCFLALSSKSFLIQSKRLEHDFLLWSHLILGDLSFWKRIVQAELVQTSQGLNEAKREDNPLKWHLMIEWFEDYIWNLLWWREKLLDWILFKEWLRVRPATKSWCFKWSLSLWVKPERTMFLCGNTSEKILHQSQVSMQHLKSSIIAYHWEWVLKSGKNQKYLQKRFLPICEWKRSMNQNLGKTSKINH